MRAALQLLFVAFYLYSSYVTTQHRVGHIVHKVEHSNSRSDDVSLQNCNQTVRYTHFREAKKAAADFNIDPAPTPRFFQVVSTRHFIPLEISLKDQFELETSHSRAPPQA